MTDKTSTFDNGASDREDRDGQGKMADYGTIGGPAGGNKVGTRVSGLNVQGNFATWKTPEEPEAPQQPRQQTQQPRKKTAAEAGAWSDSDDDDDDDDSPLILYDGEDVDEGLHTERETEKRKEGGEGKKEEPEPRPKKSVDESGWDEMEDAEVDTSVPGEFTPGNNAAVPESYYKDSEGEPVNVKPRSWEEAHGKTTAETGGKPAETKSDGRGGRKPLVTPDEADEGAGERQKPGQEGEAKAEGGRLPEGKPAGKKEPPVIDGYNGSIPVETDGEPVERLGTGTPKERLDDGKDGGRGDTIPVEMDEDRDDTIPVEMDQPTPPGQTPQNPRTPGTAPPQTAPQPSPTPSRNTADDVPSFSGLASRHAHEALKAIAETAATNIGSATSKGWDLAQGLVKMTFTNPHALSSSGRAIGLAMGSLELAGDLAEKAAKQYGINVDGNEPLKEDTLKYRLYNRAWREGAAAVGNTFRVISGSLNNLGVDDMRQLTPDQLHRHLQDLQAEKDRLLQKIQDDDAARAQNRTRRAGVNWDTVATNLMPLDHGALSRDDRGLVMAQINHLSKYMDNVSKQAKNLDRMAADSKKVMKQADARRRRQAQMFLGDGDPNPWRELLEMTDPDHRQEIDPNTGLPVSPSYVQHMLNRALAERQNRDAADALTDEDREKFDRWIQELSEYKQKIVENRRRIRMQGYGPMWEHLGITSDQMPQYAERVLRRGVWPSQQPTSYIREGIENYIRRAGYNTPEGRVGQMWLESMMTFHRAKSLDHIMSSRNVKDIDRLKQKHAGQVEKLDGDIKAMAQRLSDPTLSAHEKIKIQEMKAQAEARMAIEKRIQQDMARNGGGFSVEQRNRDLVNRQRAYQAYHEALMRQYRKSCTMDANGNIVSYDFNPNDPEFQNARREYEKWERYFTQKYDPAGDIWDSYSRHQLGTGGTQKSMGGGGSSFQKSDLSQEDAKARRAEDRIRTAAELNQGKSLHENRQEPPATRNFSGVLEDRTASTKPRPTDPGMEKRAEALFKVYEGRKVREKPAPKAPETRRYSVVEKEEAPTPEPEVPQERTGMQAAGAYASNKTGGSLQGSRMQSVGRAVNAGGSAYTGPSEPRSVPIVRDPTVRSSLEQTGEPAPQGLREGPPAVGPESEPEERPTPGPVPEPAGTPAPERLGAGPAPEHAGEPAPRGVRETPPTPAQGTEEIPETPRTSRPVRPVTLPGKPQEQPPAPQSGGDALEEKAADGDKKSAYALFEKYKKTGDIHNAGLMAVYICCMFGEPDDIATHEDLEYYINESGVGMRRTRRYQQQTQDAIATIKDAQSKGQTDLGVDAVGKVLLDGLRTKQPKRERIEVRDPWYLLDKEVWDPRHVDEALKEYTRLGAKGIVDKDKIELLDFIARAKDRRTPEGKWLNNDRRLQYMKEFGFVEEGRGFDVRNLYGDHWRKLKEAYDKDVAQRAAPIEAPPVPEEPTSGIDELTGAKLVRLMKKNPEALDEDVRELLMQTRGSSTLFNQVNLFAKDHGFSSAGKMTGRWWKEAAKQWKTPQGLSRRVRRVQPIVEDPAQEAKRLAAQKKEEERKAKQAAEARDKLMLGNALGGKGTLKTAGQGVPFVMEACGNGEWDALISAMKRGETDTLELKNAVCDAVAKKLGLTRNNLTKANGRYLENRITALANNTVRVNAGGRRSDGSISPLMMDPDRKAAAEMLMRGEVNNKDAFNTLGIILGMTPRKMYDFLNRALMYFDREEAQGIDEEDSIVWDAIQRAVMEAVDITNPEEKKIARKLQDVIAAQLRDGTATRRILNGDPPVDAFSVPSNLDMTLDEFIERSFGSDSGASKVTYSDIGSFMHYDGLQFKSYLARVKKTLDEEHEFGKKTKAVILGPLRDLRFSEDTAANNQMKARFCQTVVRLAEAKAKEANDGKGKGFKKTDGYKPHTDPEETETPDPGPNLEPTRTIVGNSRGFKAVIGLVSKSPKKVENVRKQCKDIADGITQLANRLTDTTVQSEFSELNSLFDNLTTLLRAKMNPSDRKNTATADFFRNSKELATAYDLLLQKMEGCFRLQKQKIDRVKIAKIQNNKLYNEKEKKRQIDEIEEASKGWLKNKLKEGYETLYTPVKKPEKDDSETPPVDPKVTVQNLDKILSEYPDMGSDRHREAIELYMNAQKQIAQFLSAGEVEKAQLFIKTYAKAREAYEAQQDEWDDIYRDMHSDKEPVIPNDEKPPETPDGGLVFNPDEVDDSDEMSESPKDKAVRIEQEIKNGIDKEQGLRGNAKHENDVQLMKLAMKFDMIPFDDSEEKNKRAIKIYNAIDGIFIKSEPEYVKWELWSPLAARLERGDLIYLSPSQIEELHIMIDEDLDNPAVTPVEFEGMVNRFCKIIDKNIQKNRKAL